MNLSPIQGATLGVDAGLERLRNDSRLSADEKVDEACRQFEAILLRQILGAARKSVIHADPESESAVSGIYQDMVTNQLADAIARSGDFGLARSLREEFVGRRQPPPMPEGDVRSVPGFTYAKPNDF